MDLNIWALMAVLDSSIAACGKRPSLAKNALIRIRFAFEAQKRLGEIKSAWNNGHSFKEQDVSEAKFTTLTEQARKLDLSNLGLKRIPRLIGLLTNLTDLNLNGNPELVDFSALAHAAVGLRISVIQHALEEVNLEPAHRNNLTALLQALESGSTKSWLTERIDILTHRVADTASCRHMLSYGQLHPELTELNSQHAHVGKEFDVSPWPKLKTLILDNNNVDQVENLGALVQLEKIRVDTNSFSFIQSLPKLKQITHRDVDFPELKNSCSHACFFLLTFSESPVSNSEKFFRFKWHGVPYFLRDPELSTAVVTELGYIARHPTLEELVFSTDRFSEDRDVIACKEVVDTAISAAREGSCLSKLFQAQYHSHTSPEARSEINELKEKLEKECPALYRCLKG